MRSKPRGLRAAGLMALLGLTGCLPSMSLPSVSLPPLITRQDRPKNLVERALSACFEKRDDAKIECVKAQLANGGMTPPRLIALIPGCRAGRLCGYNYQTEDRVGYVSAYATHIVYGWRVIFDLTKRPKTFGDVPVSIEVR